MPKLHNAQELIGKFLEEKRKTFDNNDLVAKRVGSSYPTLRRYMTKEQLEECKLLSETTNRRRINTTKLYFGTYN
jgi:hypothetical protein